METQPAQLKNKFSKKMSQHQFALLAICCLQFFIMPSYAGYTRNKEAAELYPYPTYSKYKPSNNIEKEPGNFSTTIDFLSKVTHFVFDSFIKDATGLPEGYIKKKNNSDILNLGTNVEINDWADLLAHYWLFALFVAVMMFLIIIIPFVAVCYCCFKGHRCSNGCPPCDLNKDARERCCYGYILALILIIILFCAVIGFLSSDMLNRGLGETGRIILQARQTSCMFLSSTMDTVNYMFRNNCEELVLNLEQVITNINRYFFTATMEGYDPAQNLSRPFANMLKAAKLMEEVELWHKDLIFYGGQFRDGLRTIKRDIVYACTVLCGNAECLRFLRTSNVQYLDGSKCLHFDMLPDPSIFVKAMYNVTGSDFMKAKEECYESLKVGRWYYGTEPLKAPLIQYTRQGKEYFRKQGDIINDIIDKVVSDLHDSTVKSAGSFSDIDGRYNTHRNLINAIACGLLLLVILSLGIALCFGYCGRRRKRISDDGFCSKTSGAKCLFIGILLIFCVFSFIILVGLFYSVLGLITYMGACAPIKNQLAIRQPDSLINLNKFQSKSPEQSERTSKVIKRCQINHTIFDLLKETGLYDIDSLFNHKVFGEIPIPNDGFFDPEYTVETYRCLSPDMETYTDILKLKDSPLSPYTGKTFTDNMCTNVTTVPLPQMITSLNDLRSSLWTQWGMYDWARIALFDQIETLRYLQDAFYFKVIDLIEKIIKNVITIDEYLLSERKPFGESIEIMAKHTVDKESEFRQTARDNNNALRKKLTLHLEDQFVEFKNMVVRECKENVGKCDPLDRSYSIGVKKICEGIVDPLNSLAFGVLLGGLLLLPALFVAHRLRCLYYKVYPEESISEDNFQDCPQCTGGASKPPLNNVDDESAGCSCNDVNQKRYQDDGSITEAQKEPK